MRKLYGKVAVITGATSGMALAGAKLFVDEGAHVFISGRRKDHLDEAVKLIGRNVTDVQADSADLDDLDGLFETVKLEKGAVDDCRGDHILAPAAVRCRDAGPPCASRRHAALGTAHQGGIRIMGCSRPVSMA